MPSFTTFPRNQSKWGPSDWSRPALKEKDEPIIQNKPTKIASTQPRFSVFGNSKSKLAMINSQKNEIIKERKDQPSLKKKNVKFDPLFLERVCLFNESQSPVELKGIHDKASNLRIICPNWTSFQNRKHIRLDKKYFSVTADNQHIKGQLMVRNLALDKLVSIKYTFDRWSTIREVDGVFFGPNPKNVTFDTYEFSLDLGHGQLADRGEMRGKIEFNIRVTAGTRDYYDDNHGQNYIIKVIADPLNWTKEEDEREDEYPTEEEEEEEKEKHNSFTNALKEYQHAKPFHIKICQQQQQPFLTTRYDFSQSLSKETFQHNYFPEPFIKPSSPPSDHIHILDNMYIPSNTTPPTSPQSSPILSSKPFLSLTPSSMDIDSSHYMNLIDKYCFYNSQ
ncbi:hypothetical protein G6F43_003006 [Rhizopus delemar]|nr:hypothetical protein G6F43_003006 [Rhizopus delemar]